MAKIDCELDRFGVVRSNEGAILNSSVNLNGLEVSASKLAEWLNIAINHHLDNLKYLPEESDERRYSAQETGSIMAVVQLLLSNSSYDLEILSELNLKINEGVTLNVRPTT